MDSELINDLKDYIINTSNRSDECLAMDLLRRLNDYNGRTSCNNMQ